MASKTNNTAARRAKLIEAQEAKKLQRVDVLPRYLSGSTYSPRNMRKGKRST